MDRPIDHIVAFRLAPAGLGFGVDVRLRRAGERWVAVVVLDGREQTALAPSPRAALTAALATLDASAVKALLADTGLLEPSVEIAVLATG